MTRLCNADTLHQGGELNDSRVEVAAPDEGIEVTRFLASHEGAPAPVRCQTSLFRRERIAVDDRNGLAVVANAKTKVLEAAVCLARHVVADELALQNRYSIGHHDRRVLPFGVHTDTLSLPLSHARLVHTHFSNPRTDPASPHSLPFPPAASSSPPTI